MGSIVGLPGDRATVFAKKCQFIVAVTDSLALMFAQQQLFAAW